MRKMARSKGLGKLEERPMSVQLKTGHYVKPTGLYACKAPRGYQGARHLLRAHWRLVKGASPGYYSNVCLLCVLCPSFEVAGQVLDLQGVACNRDRIRKLAVAFGNKCKGQQPALAHAPGESLAGKRVVVSLDGGRTRTREYDGEENKEGNATFDTPWREPELFVIDIMDGYGKVDTTSLPVYGCLFDKEETVELLGDHLKALGIQYARQVEVVADGAPWIWNRAGPMLKELGVQDEKIVEVVDYYHACSYVHKIIEGLPQKHRGRSKELLKTFKGHLWEGQIEKIVEKCEGLFKRPGKLVRRYVGYLSKNEDRMQYADFQKDKLMCGSGIVESGIRRIINLRFKNASSFWKKENVECLYFLRGILLSFRWNMMMQNLIKTQF